MAINKRVMEKIVEQTCGDENMLEFLRRLVVYEAEGSGRYTKAYEELLNEYAPKEEEQ